MTAFIGLHTVAQAYRSGFLGLRDLGVQGFGILAWALVY